MISIPGRIPIFIHPFFWFLILMIGWLNSGSLAGTAIWAVVILFSILIHEYGHALTAVLFGQKAEINLVGLGGLTKRQGPGLKRWKEFLIVLAGPLAGFALFFVSYFFMGMISKENGLLFYILRVSINVNFFWTLLNLLPVFPLDGGHLLRILLEGAFGLPGLKGAFLFSILLGAVAGLYFFLIGQVLMGALFFILAFESYNAWGEVKKMTFQDTDKDLQKTINEGLHALKSGQLNDAFEKFAYVRNQTLKGVLYVASTQYGARVLVEQGRLKEAYNWLYPLKNRLSTEYLHLLQQIAYRIQEWEEALKIGEQAYQKEPSIDCSLVNAFCCAIMGKAIPAVGWLRCAEDLGYTDAHEISNKREFDAIRHSEAFEKWKNSGQHGLS